MRKEIARTKFQIILYDNDIQLMDFSYLPNVTHKLNDKKFIKEVKVGAEMIEKYLPKKILVQTKNLEFYISPDLQVIVNDILLPVYKLAKLKKLAFLMPEDVILEMSIEQTVQENVVFHFFQTKYFHDINEAYNWLKQDE
jgi:hypothetical protein